MIQPIVTVSYIVFTHSSTLWHLFFFFFFCKIEFLLIKTSEMFSSSFFDNQT